MVYTSSRTLFLSSCFTILISMSCNSILFDPWIPDLTLSQLQSAPEQIEIGDKNLTLDATPWRDFFPGDRPMSDHSLNVGVNVIESNEQPISSSIELDYIWVVHGDNIWASLFSDEDRPPVPAYMINGIARGGEEWTCGELVDVIVWLSDHSGRIALLKSTDHPIECPR